MAATPNCPGCDRPAPRPKSAEAKVWRVGTTDESVIVVCPDCYRSPERLEQAQDNVKRANLAFAEDPRNAILFVKGEPKSIMDCTPDDLIEGQADMERRLEQVRLWREWFEASLGEDVGR
jgi:hypothetical protein